MLQASWNTPNVLWCCSRSAGKSFLGAIFIILKAILFENQSIYISAPVGDQSKELFIKIEEIVLNMGKTANSIEGLLDIVRNETVKSPSCVTGFTHSPSGYNVSFYNGSEITTLNGKEDSNRSKRATMCFFDEVGFMSENAIMVTEAFGAQDSNFKTSTRKNFSHGALRKKCPTQMLYASSASEMGTTFYKYYRDFFKAMLIGDSDYFCCDIPCDIPLNPTMNSEIHAPLLTQAKIDKAMKANPEKCLREYYNKFTVDGGENQLIKRALIVQNENFQLPELCHMQGGRYGIFFDPARSNDNSIILVGKFIKDPLIGWYGEIVNCINLLEKSNKKGNMLKSTDQIKMLTQTILDYNGKSPDYEHIEVLSIDAGAGGGGITAYADPLLDDWFDENGGKHKGFIDKNYDLYASEVPKYPNASDKLTLISPAKYRNQMCEEFSELMTLGLIKFPKEYDGKGYLSMEVINDKKESIIKHRQLSAEEEVALINIDILKTECTSIYKFKNDVGVVSKYGLQKDKENKMHDDRFYTCLLMAHRLYELRRTDIIRQDNDNSSISDYFIF